MAIGVGERSIRPSVVIVAEFRGPNEADVRADVVQRVASECGVVPSDVVFVRPGSLPRTTSGKLRRLEVKRGLEAGENLHAVLDPMPDKPDDSTSTASAANRCAATSPSSRAR